MLRGRPRIGEARAVIVADVVVLVTFWRSPAGPRRRAVRKVPREKKSVDRFSTGRDLALQAQRAGGGSLFCFWTEPAVFSEIVPEKRRAGPPLRRGPTAQITHAPIAGL